MVRTDGSWERLDAGGAVLGHFDDWDYGQAEVRLNPGDRLLLFTDGLVEAANAAGEEFGEEQLLKVAIENCHRPAEELKRAILSAAMAHCGGGFHDDATLLVLAIR